MSDYAYVAVDLQGAVRRGTLDVLDQSEALRRIKEMGLFPTKVIELEQRRQKSPTVPGKLRQPQRKTSWASLSLFNRVKPTHLAVFTRQLATLVEAGLPLLRGLRILEEQSEHPGMKRILNQTASAIEGGSSLGDALALHPGVFNRLYINMVKAGEVSGALDIALRRLAEFVEKSQKMKGRVKSALFYPCAVLFVAAAIVLLLMAYVVPRFKAVFDGLLGGQPLPAFTRAVFSVSDALQHRAPVIVAVVLGVLGLAAAALRTETGRGLVDRLKLAMPVFGPVFKKAAIARFCRTLGTLIENGVPILQALNIVKETAGNLLLSRLISRVHNRVKEGDPMAPALRESRLFPVMVVCMVDVGEQTGGLPDMLGKVADTYDEEVDNAVNAMTSLMEPVMIILLALIVGSIVIAMFLPIIVLVNGGDVNPANGQPGGGE